MYSFFPSFDCGLSYSQQEEYGVFTSEITSCVLLKVSLLACGFSALLVTSAGRGFMLMNLAEGTQTLQLFLAMMSDWVDAVARFSVLEYSKVPF